MEELQPVLLTCFYYNCSGIFHLAGLWCTRIVKASLNCFLELRSYRYVHLSLLFTVVLIYLETLLLM